MKAKGSGTVWWITGLSGAGKSTVSKLLRDALVAQGRSVLLFDGDKMREILGETSVHTTEDRRRLALTYGRLAREVAGQGFDVVFATISMFHEVRAWNRANISHYYEVYLRVPMAELELRDQRGLYSRARSGAVSNVVGLDLALEEPREPDLVIDNFGDVDPVAACARILAKVAS